MHFTVAAIVNEPKAVLDRFVGWYQAQGARAIWLFFDNPAHPDLGHFAAMDRVIATPCTPEFWASLGCRPDMRFTRRQNATLNHAYRQLADGWLLNVDADELMFARGMTLAEWIAAQDEPRTLRIAPAEHVRHDGRDLLFRLPITRAQVNDIYGTEADLFRRRFGLIGHADGKSFHRAGQSGVHLRQHWAEDASGQEIAGQRLGAADGIYLLHFVAQDYPKWREKLDWRLNSHGFPEPIKERIRTIQATSDDPEADLRKLYDLLHGISPETIARLDRVNGLLHLGSKVPRLSEQSEQIG